MTRDPSPPGADETDAELSSLFATLKDDHAPRDIESRLLRGLATAAVAGAGAAAVKSGLWYKAALWLGTGGLSKSVLVGALCGGVVYGAITVVDGLGAPAPPAGPAASATGSLVRPTGTSAAGRAPTDDNAEDAEDAEDAADAVDAAPSDTATPGAGAARGPDAASPYGSLPAPATGLASALPGERSAPVPPTGAPSAAPSPRASTDSPADSPEPAAAAGLAGAGSPSPQGTSEPNDALRRELPLVRGIAALVDSGRCAEARTAIFAYRAKHHAGQLAAEVDVLVARCQGR